MATKIEWADETWNPILGCTKVSRGCDDCYAIRTANMRRANPNPKIATAYAGLVERTDSGVDWTSRINLLAQRLTQPLQWKRPRWIFVNSQSDLFHEGVPTAYIARVFAVMAAAPEHRFQILTKRHGRMRSLLSRGDLGTEGFPDMVEEAMAEFTHAGLEQWPLPNVLLGVSVEDQKCADLRIPALMHTPAAVRFLSCEPLLGPIQLHHLHSHCPTHDFAGGFCTGPCPDRRIPDWVIVGGESGPRARAMHPAWARALRDQCTAAGIPFFFKQWGEWGPAEWKPQRLPDEAVEQYKTRAEAVGATHAHTGNELGDGSCHLYEPDHKPWSVDRVPMAPNDPYPGIRKWGKKRAGRELDGRTWDQMPEVAR